MMRNIVKRSNTDKFMQIVSLCETTQRTLQRRNGVNVEQGTVVHGVRFAPKMPLSRRRCCRRKKVSSQVICRSSASALALRPARTRSCRSTTSRSRWTTVAGDSIESVSDWDNAAAEEGNWNAMMSENTGQHTSQLVANTMKSSVIHVIVGQKSVLVPRAP